MVNASMSATIYTASELKDRRTEILEVARRGRAIVRAVDGTALVFTPLDTVQRSESVAQWAIALHGVARGRTPGEFNWLRHLDGDDRAEFLNEAINVLEDVAAGGSLESFEELVSAWRVTALTVADVARREVLLGVVSATDFVDAQRPGTAS